LVTAPRQVVLYRLASAALAIIVVPLIVALAVAADDQPFHEGEPAPRTVFATERVRVVDEPATDTARRTAAESVEPIFVFDRAAQTRIVNDLRTVFDDVSFAREPIDIEPEGEEPPSTRAPTVDEQLEYLLVEQSQLDGQLLAALVRLSDGDLATVERETIAIAQELARQRIVEDELTQLIEDDLPGELALRPLPGDTAATIVGPLIEAKIRPTVTVDPDATAAARERAAEAVPEVARVWLAEQAIVREGEIVDAMALRAIERLGAGGESALRTIVRAALAMLLATLVLAPVLQKLLPKIWDSGKRMLLLGLLVTAHAALVVGATLITDATSPGWAYAAPTGAVAMLAALLLHPIVGIAMMLPATVLVLLVLPHPGPVALFAAAVVLISVALTSRIEQRSDLRSATIRAAVAYPVLAAITVTVFGPSDELFAAVTAAGIHGLFTLIIVQGAMPFLETLFRLPTVTALLDLADRNHPLLRELEAKALGSYNHSVMVAALTERACRAVGASPLLGSVAGLYHDIGKVRQPHYFIENQQGIANPHDELEPIISAIIIQNHVIDGVEMAVKHRLPPEVVECIRTHHGTMVVSYFYDRAVTAANDGEVIDEEQFRYKGGKPRSKEAAILVLADCSEATTRAMAMNRGTLPREDIESTVDRLLAERVTDGQFDESDLTFRELATVRDTVVESLVGIYHPRIPYPAKAAGQAVIEDTGAV